MRRGIRQAPISPFTLQTSPFFPRLAFELKDADLYSLQAAE